MNKQTSSRLLLSLEYLKTILDLSYLGGLSFFLLMSSLELNVMLFELQFSYASNWVYFFTTNDSVLILAAAIILSIFITNTSIQLLKHKTKENKNARFT